MIRKTIVGLIALSLVACVVLLALSRLKKQGVIETDSQHLRLPLYADSLPENWFPRPSQETIERFDKYVDDITKGDLAAEERLLRDDKAMVSLCHGDLPEACTAIVVARGRELKKLDAALSVMADGEEKDLTETKRDLMRADIAAMSADACILGAPASCRFAFPYFRDRVMLTLLRYCEHGLGEYCTEAGFQFKKDEKSDKAIEMFVAGCRFEITSNALEDGDACNELLNGGILPVEDTRVAAARKAFDVLCETRHEESRKLNSPPCQVLSRYFSHQHDPARALSFAERSCTLGNADSCMLKAEFVLALSKDRNKVATEVRRYCRAQMKPNAKDAETCKILSKSQVVSESLWGRILKIEYDKQVKRGIATPGHRLADRAPAANIQ